MTRTSSPIRLLAALVGLAVACACSGLGVTTPSAMGVNIVGACGFDLTTLAFRGDGATQAACLLRAVGRGGAIDSQARILPAVLTELAGRPCSLAPDRVARYLIRQGLGDAALIGALGSPSIRPVSRARDNAPDAPLARYFVIHDTSTPYLGDAPFPPRIDDDSAVNDLSRYAGPDAVAHIFLNRRGEVMVGHDFSVPWRATKLESRIIGLPAKGLFLHIENVQPRRRSPEGPSGNDRIAPDPGFSPAQYDRLALLYILASLRAGTWLIPAFHANIDAGLNDAHDDPQNFRLEHFAAALAQHIKQLSPGD